MHVYNQLSRAFTMYHACTYTLASAQAVLQLGADAGQATARLLQLEGLNDGFIRSIAPVFGSLIIWQARNLVGFKSHGMVLCADKEGPDG